MRQPTESSDGYRHEHDSLALLTLGTGVGGGIIIDGKLINGVNSFGSECGHMIVDSRPDSHLCVWGGGRGHLEAYASASGVAAWAEELLSQGASSSLTTQRSAGKAVTAKQIYDAALQGDELALKVSTKPHFSWGSVSLPLYTQLTPAW